MLDDRGQICRAIRAVMNHSGSRSPASGIANGLISEVYRSVWRDVAPPVRFMIQGEVCDRVG